MEYGWREAFLLNPPTREDGLFLTSHLALSKLNILPFSIVTVRVENSERRFDSNRPSLLDFAQPYLREDFAGVVESRFTTSNSALCHGATIYSRSFAPQFYSVSYSLDPIAHCRHFRRSYTSTRRATRHRKRQKTTSLCSHRDRSAFPIL